MCLSLILVLQTFRLKPSLLNTSLNLANIFTYSPRVFILGLFSTLDLMTIHLIFSFLLESTNVYVENDESIRLEELNIDSHNDKAYKYLYYYLKSEFVDFSCSP